MNTFVNNWRIGEKIGFGFGMVGLLFLLVIWQYHSTLKKSLHDYQYLNTIYAAKKDNALNIKSGFLNARLAEKNFLLKRQPDYALLVNKHIQKAQKIVTELAKINTTSAQEANLFEQDLTNYLKHFNAVESAWKKKGLDENSGLQGSFRNAVHALEEMVSTMRYDKIYINLLQLRRREKDYLLRGDEHYINLTLSVIQVINKQVQSSPFSSADKNKFLNLLTDYKNDFTALVEQNKHIDHVIKAMETVAEDVAALVKNNVDSNTNMMNKMTDNINTYSSERIGILPWMVTFAFFLGIYFAFIITSRIVKPVRKMAIILEQLTETEIVEKMPFQENSRDEVNAMAGSLNTLADHRKRFIHWWKSTMDESEACTQLKVHLEQQDSNIANSDEFKQIQSELMDAIQQKEKLVSTELHEIQKYNDEIIKQSATLNHVSIPRDEIDNAANKIYYQARLIKKSLEMMSYKAI